MHSGISYHNNRGFINYFSINCFIFNFNYFINKVFINFIWCTTPIPSRILLKMAIKIQIIKNSNYIIFISANTFNHFL